MFELIVRYNHTTLFGDTYYDVKYIKVHNTQRHNIQQIIAYLSNKQVTGVCVADVECELYYGCRLIDYYTLNR